MQRAIEFYGEATHYVVMQDDVIPCTGFVGKVHERIRERPEDVLSLWVGDLRDTTAKFFRRAQIAGDRWSPIHFSDIHHCVALIWPRATAEAFLYWTENNMLPGDGRNQQSDDAVIGAFARRTKTSFWACVPCLVEHPDDVESTIGRPRGGRGRRAIAFTG